MRFLLAAKWRLLAAAALWAAVAVSGQEITRTQITDTIFNADGSCAVGSLRISWKSFTGADGATVAKNSFESDIVDGVVSIALAPNLGAVPDGTYYSVEYRLHRGEKSNELWIVPESEDPVSIADIRVLSVPAAGMAVSLSQVNGLPAVLDAKADKAAANTFTAPQVLRESASGTSNPLLGLQKNDGAAGVYFRLPELSGDVTYTLPPNAGSPNQALTTDGNGALSWSSAAGGGAGSGSAYEVLQQGGTSVAQRTVANFASGFVVSDNAGQLRTDIAPNFGTTAGTITQGNDSRLSNARTPLAHAATHATGGSDPLTPLSIGALNRTNDFMVGTSPTTPVLKLQGSTGQAAALQEWRDGSGALAALITAQGNGFFRELGVSAPTGGTTVSQFFEVGGLKKFALSATDGVFDILRYDNAGVFLDRPLRVFRNGSIETAVSVKVADAAVGSGLLGLTGNYAELQAVATPSAPAPGFGRIYLDSASGEVSVKKSSGAVVSLEGYVGGNSEGVIGPDFSTDEALPRFDGAGGDTLQGSGVTIDDDDNVSIPGALAVGAGSSAPFNLTGYTDTAAPSAPGAENQFTEYWDRTSGLHCWILNAGSAQCSLTSAQVDTFAELDAVVVDRALANLEDAQTFAVGTKTVTAKFDFSDGTLEAPNSSSLPGTCAVGEVYFDSGETAGLNLYGCTASNVWTRLGDGNDGTGCVVDSRIEFLASRSNASGFEEGGGLYQTAAGTADALSGSDAIGVAYGEIHDGVVTVLNHLLEDCYGGEDLTVEIIGTPPGSSVSGTGSFDIDYICVAVGENWGGGRTDTGSDITVNMSGDTVQDLLKYSQTFSTTGCAAGEMAVIQATYAAGTLADDLRLIGMRVHN